MYVPPAFRVDRATCLAFAAARGSLENGCNSTATCLANDTPTTSATDAVTPAPGQGFYYLVRCATAGTYNDGTQTGSRTPTACP